MPALAAVAALLQAVTALLTANSYRTTEGLSILTGVAWPREYPASCWKI